MDGILKAAGRQGYPVTHEDPRRNAKPMVIVQIDDLALQSAQEMRVCEVDGRAPAARQAMRSQALLARTLRAVAAAKPKVIVVDLLIEAETCGTEQLVAALREIDVPVVFPRTLVWDAGWSAYLDRGHVLDPHRSGLRTVRFGHVEVRHGAGDGRMRRMDFWVRVRGDYAGSASVRALPSVPAIAAALVVDPAADVDAALVAVNSGATAKFVGGGVVVPAASVRRSDDAIHVVPFRFTGGQAIPPPDRELMDIRPLRDERLIASTSAASLLTPAPGGACVAAGAPEICKGLADAVVTIAATHNFSVDWHHTPVGTMHGSVVVANDTSALISGVFIGGVSSSGWHLLIKLVIVIVSALIAATVVQGVPWLLAKQFPVFAEAWLGHSAVDRALPRHLGEFGLAIAALLVKLSAVTLATVTIYILVQLLLVWLYAAPQFRGGVWVAVAVPAFAVLVEYVFEVVAHLVQFIRGLAEVIVRGGR